MLLSMKSFKVYGVGTLFLFIFGILSAGCVKENRDKCPCRLIVDLSDVDSSRISSVDVLLAGQGGIVYETIRHSDSYGSDEVVLVPRDELFLNVCWGDGGMMGMDGLVIPEGLSSGIYVFGFGFCFFQRIYPPISHNQEESLCDEDLCGG